MKQAILIMAHNNFEQLRNLIDFFDNKYFDLYVHFDLKCDKNIVEDFQKSYPKTHFYHKFNIKWAHLSQTLCELFLLEEAKKGDYKYYHLISGLDIPLKKNEDIYNFFNKSNYEFLHFQSKSVSKIKKDFIQLYRPLLCFKNFKKSKVLKGLDIVMVYIQKLFKINRIKHKKIVLYTGANWFSITNDFAEYVLRNYDFIMKVFKYTKSSDEFFLQTLLMNSSFKDRLYNNCFNNSYISCMRYIDWERGNPYTWKIDDYNELINSNYIFARKVDANVDHLIIDKIYDFLRKGD